MCAGLSPLDALSVPACPVLPAPAEYKSLPGQVELAAARKLLLCPGTADSDRRAAEEMNLWLSEMGLDTLAVVDYKPGLDSRGCVLVGPSQSGSPVREALTGKTAPGGEAYLLSAENNRVVVAGGDPAGRFYGLMSLAQLIRAGKGRSVPACFIQDSPALALRGLSDDISRGQVSTQQDFERLVRFLARYKMNLYMPYIEDMFSLKSRPDFGAGRGALSAAEVQSLAAFSSALHVRLVPAFQTLGHYDNYLLRPDNFPLAEFPGAQCLSPAVPEIYPFLGQALSELCAVFPDSLVNVGCDETWDIGRGKSRARVRNEGLAAVHTAHYRKVHEIVGSLGRTMLMYGDIVLDNPKILEPGILPRDIVIVDWHYESAADYPSVARFRQAGFKVLVSPGLSNWSRFYPFWGTALDNIQNMTRAGQREGALGALTSSWCDFGAPNLRGNALWGWAFAAACAWNPSTVDRDSLERLFWRQLLGVEDPEPLITANSLLAGIGRSAFDDWWRHPLAGPSPRGMIKLKKDGAAWGATLKADMVKALSALAAARQAAGANRDFLDIMDLAARMGQTLAGKFSWMDRAARAGQGALSKAEAAELARQARELRQSTTELRGAYRELWLRYNRPEGLDNLLSLWDRQLLYWDSIISSLDREGRLPQWELSSPWIAPSASLPGKRLDKERTALYAADFDLPSGVDSVKIQLMGESHVEAWVNGKWAGRKVARLCLSEIVDRERAVLLDLTGLTRPGRNRLAFSVTNYEGKVPALNVCGEVYSGGKVIARPASALTWRAMEASSAPAGWNAPGFTTPGWSTCGQYKYDNPVSRPFFSLGLPSRVER
ncbi:beta-N-acetylhexosaminidase [bacterium]|nr:beta-N-acetylhexosaminidase [bacterium]